MKRHCWGTIMLLVLLSSCANLPSLLAQTSRSPLAPQKMHVCINTACEDAEWVGDHYEGHQNGVVSNRYWLVTWQPDQGHILILS